MYDEPFTIPYGRSFYYTSYIKRIFQILRYVESNSTSVPNHSRSEPRPSSLYSAAEDVGQELRENIDVGIQAATETLDHQHAENHAAEGSVLLDSVANHRGE